LLEGQSCKKKREPVAKEDYIRLLPGVLSKNIV